MPSARCAVPPWRSSRRPSVRRLRRSRAPRAARWRTASTPMATAARVVRGAHHRRANSQRWQRAGSTHQRWNWRNPRLRGAERRSGGNTVGSPRDRHSRGRRRDTTTASPTATILGATTVGADPMPTGHMTTGKGNRSARTGRIVMAGAPTTGQTVGQIVGKTITRTGTRAGARHRDCAREAMITAGSARH